MSDEPKAPGRPRCTGGITASCVCGAGPHSLTRCAHALAKAIDPPEYDCMLPSYQPVSVLPG